MKRRDGLTAGTALAATLPAPQLRAQAARILRLRPSGDLSVLGPIWSSAFIRRHHSNAVFDALYGMDNRLNPHPQQMRHMVRAVV